MWQWCVQDIENFVQFYENVWNLLFLYIISQIIVLFGFAGSVTRLKIIVQKGTLVIMRVIQI